MNKNLIIRTDASVEIGTGHVMRCLTLADELRGRGAEVFFVCREFEGNLCDYIEEKNFVVIRLPVCSEQAHDFDGNLKHESWLGTDWQTDARQVKKIIKDLDAHPDWIVVDHYAIDKRWEGYLRQYAINIMVIDDLADRVHNCDLLLDQNYFDNLESRYDDLVTPQAKKLIGPKYALLRSEFRVERNKYRKHSGRMKKILVFLGGCDPSNETAKVLHAIRLLNRPNITVDVVVGKTNPYKEQIKQYCSTMNNVIYSCQVENMAKLMADADLFIGGGGSTTLERLCLGLPSIVITTAENQEESIQNLAANGYLISAGRNYDATKNQIKKIFQCLDKNNLNKMSEKGRLLVDGMGTERVVNTILSFLQ